MACPRPERDLNSQHHRKSNYHTITTTTAPIVNEIRKDHLVQIIIYFRQWKYIVYIYSIKFAGARNDLLGSRPNNTEVYLTPFISTQNHTIEGYTFVLPPVSSTNRTDRPDKFFYNYIKFVCLFNAVFKTISLKSWRSVLLVEETGGSTKVYPSILYMNQVPEMIY
jgi:hypothetical protein